MNIYLSIYLSDQLGAATELSSGILLDPKATGPQRSSWGVHSDDDDDDDDPSVIRTCSSGPPHLLKCQRLLF